MAIRYFRIILFAIVMSHLSHAVQPVVPTHVLSAEEIATIKDNKNFFLRDNLLSEGPIWNHLERKYGSHYLKTRTEMYSFQDVLHRALSDGFPIHYKIEELYRSGMNRHIALGNLIPRASFTMGNGPMGVDVNNFATNLFGFLLPHNWLALIQSKKANTATKYLFIKAILDQYYQAELIYLDVHQLIQDFEIRNFYLIHLQLLCEYLGISNEDNLTLAGKYANLGTDMATNRGNIKLRFEDLAEVMVLGEDRDHHYAAQGINIENVVDFPDRVKDLSELTGAFANEEDFIIEVLNKSVELKAAKELYEISKLGVGVTASGSIFTSTDSPTDNYIRLGVTLGYDTMPRILNARSLSRTAEIDVQAQFLQMVVGARRAFDASTNAMGGYAEAHRAMELDRKAFHVHLNQLLENGAPEASEIALFLQDFANLIDTELKLNNALHGALKARALMRRLLITEEEHLLQYLPADHQVAKLQRFFMAEFPQYSRKGSFMTTKLREITTVAALENLLNGNVLNWGKINDKLTPQETRNFVENNMPILMQRHRIFHDRGKEYYLLLHSYAVKNKLKLSADEQYRLKKRAGLPATKLAFGKQIDPEYHSGLGCRHRKDLY